MLPQWGCGGSAERAEQGAASGGSSATVSTTTAGGASTSGGSGGVGGGGSGGDATGSDATGSDATGSVGGSGAMTGAGGGSVSTSGAAATGGASGAGGGPSFTDDREREILSPLWTDASTLQAASGDELLELARAIALGRGYAMCRCGGSPDGPPADVEALFEDCAVYSAEPYMLGEPDNFRCVREFGDQVPGLDEQLRCAAVGALDEASRWLATCDDVGAVPPKVEWPSECLQTPDFMELEEKCHDAYYCQDGTFASGFVDCDGFRSCPDLSDEFECFDSVGQDLVVCANGTLMLAGEACSSECEIPLTRDTCLGDGWYLLLCPDGTEIESPKLCNREADCPGGEDETICLR